MRKLEKAANKERKEAWRSAIFFQCCGRTSHSSYKGLACSKRKEISAESSPTPLSESRNKLVGDYPGMTVFLNSIFVFIWCSSPLPEFSCGKKKMTATPIETFTRLTRSNTSAGDIKFGVPVVFICGLGSLAWLALEALRVVYHYLFLCLGQCKQCSCGRKCSECWKRKDCYSFFS